MSPEAPDDPATRTRLCSLSIQNRMALPTSLRFWKHTVLSSAYSTMSFSWWWKNSRIPEWNYTAVITYLLQITALKSRLQQVCSAP